MRLSTRIRASVMVVVVLAAVICVALLIGFSFVRAQVERNDRIATALDGMFELSVLTTDYLTYGEDRAVRQWLIKYDSLGSAIEGIQVAEEPNRVILERVEDSHARIGGLFDELVEARGSIDQGSPGDAARMEHSERIVAQMLIASQDMVSDTIELSEQTSTGVVRDMFFTFFAVLTISVLGVAAAVAYSIQTDRSVAVPLERLFEATRKVGSGDLGYRTGLAESPDELGDLARAFDLMVEDLERAYADLQREIDERRQAETRLEEYRDQLETMVEERTGELSEALVQLEAASAAQNRFMASMTHELRTPLNSIIGFTGVMLGELAGPLTDEQRRQLEMVRRSGQHLLGLISDVLDFSRIEADGLDVHPMEVDIGQLVNSAIALLTPLANEKGIDLGCVVEHDAPRAAYTDPGKLEQIILNVVENGIKFTAEGKVVARLAARGADRFTVSVSDTGTGIPASDLDRVFERFHRAVPLNTPAPGGTGLGLAISRSIAEALGGTLSVESTVGAGSVFVLELPVRFEVE